MPGPLSILKSKWEFARRWAILRLPRWAWLQALARDYADGCQGLDVGYIKLDGEWRLIRESLPGAKVAFDIGAHEGTWAELALRAEPGLELHCFEPSSATFARLKAKPWGPKVRLLRMAMGEAPGQARLHVFAEGSGINSLVKREGWESYSAVPASQRSEKVQVSTVEAYCRSQGIRQVDFIKVDVEGFELKVLKGMAGLLRQGKVGRVQFEFGPPAVDARLWMADLFAFFKGKPYRLHRILPWGLKPLDGHHFSLEVFDRTQNLVAVRKGL